MNSHPDLSQCPCLDKYKFAFVRNPTDVYKSYWQYKMGIGWDSGNHLDRNCRSDNFAEFVEKVIQKYPGICSKTFEIFVGSRGSEIEYIGKYEHLCENLIAALYAAGEEFDEDAIRRCPPKNVSNKDLFPAYLTPELESRIRLSERDALKRFFYGQQPQTSPRRKEYSDSHIFEFASSCG